MNKYCFVLVKENTLIFTLTCSKINQFTFKSLLDQNRLDQFKELGQTKFCHRSNML